MINTKTQTMTETNTFKEHLQRAILVTCDKNVKNSDILSVGAAAGVW